MVGKRVCALRKARGWSQGALGERANLNPTSISRIEHGERVPTLTDLAKLAEAFGLTLPELLETPTGIKPTPAEDALQMNEERFRAVAETASDAIVSADKRGHITYFNPGAERIFGYAARDVIGRPLTLLMPERFHDAHRQGFARFLTTGEARVIGRTVELMGRRREGTEFPLELSLASWKARGDIFFTGILRDITDRKRAEQAILESEKLFHLMVEGVKDYAIFMLDPEGRVATWNAGTERLKGYRADEIIGQHFSRFYPAEDVQRGKPEHALKMAVNQGRSEDEGWRVRKDGSRFWANVIITPMRDEGGTLRGFTKVSRDLTERKQVEEELNKSKEQLEAANKQLERALRGFIPICASCKKIRDDKGDWQQIETYIQERSEAQFSHSICQDCMKKLYPDFASQ